MLPLHFFSIAALSSVLAAQAVTLPSAVVTTRPNTSYSYWTGNVFYSTTSTTTLPDSHSQSIYDVNDITPTVGLWNSLSVRRPTGLGNANVAFTANATIIMSVSALSWSAVTNTFATNAGASPVTVLSGPISLPARANPTTWPAPWEAPFMFTAPFVYVKIPGGSLVVDIYQTGNNGGSLWYLEATPVDTGARTSNPSAQSTCKFSNGNYNSGLSYPTNRLPGVNWYVTYSSLGPNLIGAGAIGAQGVGGSWAGQILPISLAAFGAPGCSWSVSADITVPLLSNASNSSTWPTIMIPNNPIFAGTAFYDHAMFNDPLANPWGMVTTWSSKWTIGTGLGAPGSLLYATGNSAANATGTLNKGTVPSFMLN